MSENLDKEYYYRLENEYDKVHKEYYLYREAYQYSQGDMDMIKEVFEKKIKEYKKTIKVLRKILLQIQGVISESQGVTGWHLNGNIATWDEFDFTAQINQILGDKKEESLCEK